MSAPSGRSTIRSIAVMRPFGTGISLGPVWSSPTRANTASQRSTQLLMLRAVPAPQAVHIPL